MQKFHKTNAHDEMTEIFRCYKVPVNKVNFFAQWFSGIIYEIMTPPCNVQYVAGAPSYD